MTKPDSIVIGPDAYIPAGANLTAPTCPTCCTHNHRARPTVVVLCGSTKFSEAFRDANLRETLAGRIVLSIGCDMRSDAELFDTPQIDQIKADLDELHKRKIDLADEVLVLNVGGYVGDSTRSEIAYAEQLGKPIRWLEDARQTSQLGTVRRACGCTANTVTGENVVCDRHKDVAYG